MLTILYFLQKTFFEKLCAINEHYCSKKLQNNMCLKYAFFKECSIFRTFNIHNFSTTKKITHSNNLHNFDNVNYANFQITLKISHFQSAHNFSTKKKELHIHQTYSKNLHNFVRLKYTIFQKMLKITHVQRTHFKKK